LAQTRQQRSEIPRHVRDPQNRMFGTLRIIDEEVIKPFHAPESELARQQLEPPVTE